MDEDFAYCIVDKCEYAILSMILENGTPYCIPLSIVRKGRIIYFHCALEGKKTEALEKNPQVCLACVGDTHRMEDKFTTEYESAVILGYACKVCNDTEKINALRLLCQRHTPLNMDEFESAVQKSLHRTAVWRITVDSITGKRKKYSKNGQELKFGRIE